MVKEIPWTEDAPRIVKDNFYFHQEDLLYTYATSKNWRWLVTRPNVILGVSKGLSSTTKKGNVYIETLDGTLIHGFTNIGNFMNFAVSIALYASLQKELEKELIFPGNEIEYNQIFDHSSADNNSRFQVFLSLNDKIPSGAFNITNNDRPKFSELWPKIAE
jgi:hypothetical protein